MVYTHEICKEYFQKWISTGLIDNRNQHLINRFLILYWNDHRGDPECFNAIEEPELCRINLCANYLEIITYKVDPGNPDMPLNDLEMKIYCILYEDIYEMNIRICR